MLSLSEATLKTLRQFYLSPEDRAEITVDDADENKLRVRLFADFGDGLPRSPSWNATYFPKAFPEKRKLGGHSSYIWEVPCTLQNAQIIDHLKDRYNGQIDIEGFAQAQLDIVNATNKLKFQNAKVLGRWREAKKYPFGTNAKLDHPDHPLMAHQKIGRHCIMENTGFAAFKEQGTGKTPMMINAMCNLARKKRRKDPDKKSLFRVLVVVPKNIRYNWQEEIDFFSVVKHKTAVIRGDAFKREKELLFSLLPDKDYPEISFTIVSYGSMVQSIDAFALDNVAGKKIKVKWDAVILDESHYIKTPRAKRTKASFRLRDAAKRRYVLSGTPITNTLLDLWSQLEFLGKGLSGFTTFNAFKEYFGVYKLDQMGHRKLVEFENIPHLQEILAKTSMIVTKAEVMPNLPDKVYDTVECSMSKEQAAAYVKVATEIFIEAEQELAAAQAAGKNQEMILGNILTRMLRLSQVTSGFMKYDDVKDDDGKIIEVGATDRFNENRKLETLVEILKKKSPDEKTIVWAHWKQDIKTIAARLRLEGIKCVTYNSNTKEKEREKAKDDFNKDPSLKVFIGSAGAGGVGLNLLGFDPKNPDDYSTYCSHVIYFSQDWSQPKRSQSEDRCHRKGSEELKNKILDEKKCHVQYTDLVIPGTIDQEIRARVRMKRDVAKSIQDVKAILKKLAGLEPVVNGD